MKMSILSRNDVSKETVELVSRLVELIRWPSSRQAMGDITLSLLDGKARVAEEVFGWSRTTVELGINELRTGIRCVNDVSNRRRRKAEEREPKILAAIQRIIDPQSQADPQLRTSLAYTNLTAKAVHDALQKEGWQREDLPTVRTISNILNRHGYRLQSVAKIKVQKKRRKPTASSKMSGEKTNLPMRAQRH
jgi:hypothetical protein